MKTDESPNKVQPLLVTGREAARMLGISISTFHKIRNLGLVGPQPVRVAGSVRFRCKELSDWVDYGCPDEKQWQAIIAAKKLPYQ